MTIALNPELEKFVAEKVRAGEYASPQALLEAAIARLMLDPEPLELDDETLAAIEEGDAQLDRGEGIPMDEAFRRFCSEHSLGTFVPQSVQLARQLFQIAGPISTRKDIDPETSEEAAVINVPVTGTPEVLYQQYKQYLCAIRGFPDHVQGRLRLMLDPVS